jgi:hypothetical protein
VVCIMDVVSIFRIRHNNNEHHSAIEMQDSAEAAPCTTNSSDATHVSNVFCRSVARRLCSPQLDLTTCQKYRPERESTRHWQLNSLRTRVERKGLPPPHQPFLIVWIGKTYDSPGHIVNGVEWNKTDPGWDVWDLCDCEI